MTLPGGDMEVMIVWVSSLCLDCLDGLSLSSYFMRYSFVRYSINGQLSLALG